MIFQPQIVGKPLPTLTNPGTAADLLSGKQLIDANGKVLTGTLKLETGAYTGTGEFGQDHPNSILLKSVPKMVLIYRTEYDALAVIYYNPAAGIYFGPFETQSISSDLTVSVSGKKITWYSDRLNIYQMNVEGAKYQYYAIG